METLLLQKRTSLTAIAILVGCAWPAPAGCPAQPEILGISPASGPEGTRVEINGKNLAEVSAVLFGTTQAVFDSLLDRSWLRSFLIECPHPALL
jgi:hypothetical protein